MKTLSDKTIIITGASRGIGREIALRCAKEGANIVIIAKSDKAHPKLKGTIYSVAEEVEETGGKALAIKIDVRNESEVNDSIEIAVQTFGGIDALINNASAIHLKDLQNTDLKRYDLIHSINTRGTFICSKAAIPHLKQATNPHIVTLSPPLNLEKHWLGPFIPYTLSKYGMTLLALGMAEELRVDGIASNTLWPKTTIATDAVKYAIDEELMNKSRTPEIVADAVYELLLSDCKKFTGASYLDENLLIDRGYVNFDKYKYHPNCTELQIDLFVDEYVE